MEIKKLKLLMKDVQADDFLVTSRSVIEHFAVRENLFMLIRSIIGDSCELEKIAKESFHHNLGFIRMNIVSWNDSDCMVKIHIWNLEDEHLNLQSREDSIHDHRYGFRSIVLSGTLVNKIYSESVVGIEHIKYESPLTESQYIFRQLGHTWLQQDLEVHMPEGTRYWISQKNIHSAEPKYAQFVATLCVQGTVEEQNTYIYSKVELSVEEKPNRFSSDQLKDILLIFLEKLEHG